MGQLRRQALWASIGQASGEGLGGAPREAGL